MEIDDSLMLAPVRDSSTFAVRVAQLLPRAEGKFGKKLDGFCFVGVELHAARPCLQYYPGNFVSIRIRDTCAKDIYQAHYQLAHEVVHLLSPTGKADSNLLEEGMAEHFAQEYYAEGFKPKTMRSAGAIYNEAAAAVAKLLAIDPSAVIKLRQTEPTISKITGPAILAAYPALGADLANFLGGNFAEEEKARQEKAKANA